MTTTRLESVRAPAAAALALLFTGCAASLAANRKSPGVTENGMFKPSRPPADHYGPDPKLTCPDRGHNGAVATAVDDRLGAKAPKPDGRLCAIADTLLGWNTGDRNEPPPETVRAFLSQYFGVPNTVRNILITNLETEKEGDVAAALVEPIANFAATAQHPIYGLMTERAKKGVTHVSLVMFDEAVQLEPVPRKLAAGASAPLAGKLSGTLKSPKVQVVDPLGKLEKVGGEGQAFKGEIKCGDKPGKILVQVGAENEGADVLAGNFAISCAAEPAVAVKIPGAGEQGPIDPKQAEVKLSELLNGDRTAVGLQPLKVNEALSKIARGISEDRAKGKGLSSVELTNQLKDADIATPLVLESAAQSFGVDEAYTRFSESPPDRANAMRGDITDVGIGVSKGADIGGKPSIIVTELFVTQLPPPDADNIKKKLFDAIAKKRADAGKAPAAKDPTLSSVAQKYAEAAVAASGPVPREKEGEILAPLYKESMTVNQVGGFVPNEETALSVADQPSLLGDSKLLGVGVAVGRSPQFGKNSPFVMVLLGTRHAPAKKGAGAKAKAAPKTPAAPKAPPAPKR